MNIEDGYICYCCGYVPEPPGEPGLVSMPWPYPSDDEHYICDICRLTQAMRNYLMLPAVYPARALLIRFLSSINSFLGRQTEERQRIRAYEIGRLWCYRARCAASDTGATEHA